MPSEPAQAPGDSDLLALLHANATATHVGYTPAYARRSRCAANAARRRPTFMDSRHWPVDCWVAMGHPHEFRKSRKRKCLAARPVGSPWSNGEAMNLQLCIGLTCLLSAGAACASDHTRITGSAILRPVEHAEVTSEEGHFRMESTLRAAPLAKQEAGGSSLSANLSAPENMMASCAPAGDLIFENGFDQTAPISDLTDNTWSIIRISANRESRSTGEYCASTAFRW